MSTSAPTGHEAPTHRADRHAPAQAGTRPNRYVSWAWGLIALTLPAGIVAVLLVEAVAAVTDLGAGETMGASGWENVALFAAVAAPLLASVVVGVRGWRREGQSLALRAALVSAGLLVIGAALALMS